jgi:4-hydroxy 2-oxovalerate aldolase
MAYHGFKNKTDEQLDLQTLEDGIHQINQLDSLGYETSFNIGRIDKLSREQLAVVCEKISKTNVKYFYMADTYGSVDIFYIDYLIPYVKELLSGTSIQIGFHTHDNYSDATTKALYSIKHGVNIIDGCSLGYGRGSGNAKTEVLMMYLNKHYYKEYEFIPIIDFGDKNLIHYKEKNSYNAVYALCAHLGCHVTYGIEIIENYPTMDIRDIFLTLVTIRSKKKHMFFYDKLFMETYYEIKQSG